MPTSVQTTGQIGGGILPARLNLTVSALVALAFIALSALRFWGSWAVDFSALFLAGHFYSIGNIAEIYAAPPEVISPEMPASWAAAVAALGYEGAQTYAFIYPPWVAAAMSPVTALDPQVAMNAWTVLNAALLMVGALLAHRIMGRPLPLWLWLTLSAAFAALTLPAQSALSLGQAQILVTVLTLLAFERQRANAPIAAGGALALAAALKLTPAAFVLVFLAARDWRATSAFAVMGALLAALSLTLFGWGPHETYLARLATISDQLIIAFFAFSVENFLFEGWTALAGTAPLHTEIEYHFAKPLWVSAASKAGLLAALALLWMKTRSDLSRFTLGLAIALPLFGPLGWAHYYLVALALLPGLFTLAGPRTAALVLAAFTLLLSVALQLALNEPPRTFFPQITLMVPMFIVLLLITAATRRQTAQPEARPVPAA